MRRLPASNVCQPEANYVRPRESAQKGTESGRRMGSPSYLRYLNLSVRDEMVSHLDFNSHFHGEE